MDLQGEVRGVDGELVEPNAFDNWRVYAYHLDNLYRFEHSDPNGSYNSTKPVNANDVVNAVLAPKGLCYGSTYVQDDGRFIMHIYGQTDESPGFQSGDTIFLVVADPNDNAKYLMTNNCSNDSEFYLTWDEGHDVSQSHNIDLSKYDSKPLDKGWNLVSISTLKRYIVHDGVTPVVEGRSLEDELTGAKVGEKVAMTRIDEVIPSLHRQWSRIFTVDTDQPTKGDAIRTSYPYDPDELDVNELKIQFFSIGYGYWIYVPDVSNAEMVVLGDVANTNETTYQMPLDPGVYDGWNLVGYWGGGVSYTTLPNEAHWSTALNGAYIPMVDIQNAFWSFGSGLTHIKAYYDGAQSWYSSYPELGDLNCVGSGYGYWVKISSSCDVRWYPQQ
jgi:hypothetical protein